MKGGGGKGVGQLDNAALIKNICRFCGTERKNIEWWEKIKSFQKKRDESC